MNGLLKIESADLASSNGGSRNEKIVAFLGRDGHLLNGIFKEISMLDRKSAVLRASYQQLVKIAAQPKALSNPALQEAAQREKMKLDHLEDQRLHLTCDLKGIAAKLVDVDETLEVVKKIQGILSQHQ
jgi:hypothetical protein